MPINGTVQSIWTLESTLEDQGLYGNDLVPIGGNPEYARFTEFNLTTSRSNRRFGLSVDDVYLSASGLDFSASDKYKLVISFWWTSPAALGQQRHAVTRQLTSTVAPLMAKASNTISNGEESLSDAEFVVMEAGISSSQNAIRFAMSSDGTTISHVVESAPYSPGLHHVYIAYEQSSIGGTIGHARIDIDGQKGDINVVGGITSYPTSDFVINRIGYGYTAHKTTATGGILGDIFVARESGVLSDKLMLKLNRFGWEWAADSSLSDTEATFNGIGYHQPSTITTNQIFTDGGNVFVSRSNGDLVKGFQPIWDTEFDFKNSSAIGLLNTSQTDSERKAEWTTSGLYLKGTTVRI